MERCSSVVRPAVGLRVASGLKSSICVSTRTPSALDLGCIIAGQRSGPQAMQYSVQAGSMRRCSAGSREAGTSARNSAVLARTCTTCNGSRQASPHSAMGCCKPGQ